MTSLLYYTFFHHLIGSGSFGRSWINDPKRDDIFHIFVSIVNRKMPLVFGTSYREKKWDKHLFSLFTVYPPFFPQCCECGALGSNATVSLCIRGIYLSLSISLFPFDGEIHESFSFQGLQLYLCICTQVNGITYRTFHHSVYYLIHMLAISYVSKPIEKWKNKNMNKKPKQNWKRKRE